METKASIQHYPGMKDYYEQGASSGKHHLTIMNEVKFKLVLRMFAVVKKGELYVKKIKNLDAF